jgi:hypothetical protein
MVAKRRERRSKTRTEKNPNPQSNKTGGSRFTPLFQEDEKVEAHSEQVEEVAPESSKQTLAKGVKNQALKDITNVGKTKAKGKSREGILKFAAENQIKEQPTPSLRIQRKKKNTSNSTEMEGSTRGNQVLDPSVFEVGVQGNELAEASSPMEADQPNVQSEFPPEPGEISSNTEVLLEQMEVAEDGCRVPSTFPEDNTPMTIEVETQDSPVV